MYHVDSFTDRIFSGNPAGVCPLPAGWPDDELMQNIALENNLAETAFYIHDDRGYQIRWFTPAVEVDLCGHATLAAAHIYFTREKPGASSISFGSRSGMLTIRKDGDCLTMNFPADEISRVDLTAEIRACFEVTPREVYRGKTDYMIVFDSEEQIATIRFDLNAIAKLSARGVIVTAKGNECDFVSRFFAPQVGVSEDPVTGSAHTTLAPYWSAKLNKNELTAMQLSPRRGTLVCRNLGGRTEISGKAMTYLVGEIEV